MSKYLAAFFKPGIMFTVCLFLFLTSYDQTGTITGTIKGSNGEPLAGASIQLKGNRAGVLADENGNYTLQSPAGFQNIIISFVGYAARTFNVSVPEGGTVKWDAILTEMGDLSNVTVIGTRNLSRTRVETPVPVDIIPISQVIDEIGQVDLNQIMNYIAPSFQSARQTIADGTDHVDPAQLRGLGTDQVLVLINGKRRHQSALVNVNGTINRGQVSTDMSTIPATAVERIEILRDGAAAQYGSDAIAGVINIVLKNKTGLLEAGVSYGGHVTEYDKNYALYKLTNNPADPSESVRDGGNFQASLGYGFKVGTGTLHLNGEYIRRSQTNRTGTYTGAVYPNIGGVNRDDSIMNARGLNRNDFDMRIGNSDMKGGAAFYNFDYPVSVNTNLYVFGG